MFWPCFGDLWLQDGVGHESERNTAIIDTVTRFSPVGYVETRCMLIGFSSPLLEVHLLS
jgi:hypothetical protein